jgi:hypothetical protein
VTADLDPLSVILTTASTSRAHLAFDSGGLPQAVCPRCGQAGIRPGSSYAHHMRIRHGIEPPKRGWRSRMVENLHSRAVRA